MVRKLRGGVMPPAGRPRPDEATQDAFVARLATELDDAAAVRPDPGRTATFHRLNRAEYRNAIRDLLAIEIDAADFLPADDSSYGFDNIGGVLRMSQTPSGALSGSRENHQPAGRGQFPAGPDRRDVSHDPRRAAARPARETAVRHAGRPAGRAPVSARRRLRHPGRADGRGQRPRSATARDHRGRRADRAVQPRPAGVRRGAEPVRSRLHARRPRVGERRPP